MLRVNGATYYCASEIYYKRTREGYRVVLSSALPATFPTTQGQKDKKTEGFLCLYFAKFVARFEGNVAHVMNGSGDLRI